MSTTTTTEKSASTGTKTNSDWCSAATGAAMKWGEGGEARIPTWLMPSDYEYVEKPARSWTMEALEREAATAAARFSAARKFTFVGKVRTVTKSTMGQVTERRYYLEGKTRVRLWIGEEITAFNLLQTLSQRVGKTVRLRGVVARGKRGFYIKEPVPVQHYELGMVRPRYAMHASSEKRMVRQLEEAQAEGAYRDAYYLALERVQYDMRRGIEEQMDSYIEDCFVALVNECLNSRQARVAAFGTGNKLQIRTKLGELLRVVHSTGTREVVEAAYDEITRVMACCIYDEPVQEGLLSAKLRAERTAGAPGLGDMAAKGYEGEARRLAKLHLGFKPREDQIKATVETFIEMDSGSAMRHLLIGDVGYGKTTPMILVIAAALEAGMRVAVMLPRSVLAEETLVKMQKAFPGLDICFKAGTTKKLNKDAKLWVGTTGLEQSTGVKFDLVVVDEQQGFSEEQRAKYLKADGHMLEITATPIARTLNRAMGNVQTLSRLTHCHVDKTFHNFIRIGREHGPRVLKSVERCIARGQNAIVCYTQKTETTGGLLSVEGTREFWEKRLGDRAVFLHGSMKDDVKKAAIESFSKRKGQVLVTTTVVEVGLNLPEVRLVVAVDPQQHGRFTLHQLRGRGAREGGRMVFMMYTANTELSFRGMHRMIDLAEHADGFELARLDELEKGCGDTSDNGKSQKGKVKHPYFNGVRIGATVMEAATNALAAEHMKLKRFQVDLGVPARDEDEPAAAAA